MTEQKTEEKSEDIIITYEDFCMWKQFSVTRKLFTYLQEVYTHTIERRLDGSYLQEQEGLLKLNFLHGYSTALSEILNIKFEEDKDDDETESPVL